MTNTFIYDEVPYPSFTFPQTHPDRIATIAKLHKMHAADPKNCRVLELGCGDGTNLISFADALPASNFVGIDLSSHHINAANETAKHLALANIAFRQADVTELLTSELGKFDFIIAHGLYSWVPDLVREAILSIYSDCLSDNGIGYISYNTYPGCHLRQISFAMLQYSTHETTDPMTRVESGIDNLREITEATQENSVVRSTLAFEYEQMLERSPENVFHDEFATINQPFYFHEFAAKIGEYGFQFLAEADPTTTNEAKLTDNGRKLLDSVDNDIIRREQYFDFIRFTRFRRTLFCRDGVQFNRSPDPTVLHDLLISSHLNAELEQEGPTDESPVKFSDSTGISVTINHPLTKAALRYLKSRWSGGVPFDELIAEAAKILEKENIAIEDKHQSAAFLLHLFKAGLVKLNIYQRPFAEIAGEFPEVGAFARWQIENGGESVLTLTGNNLEVKEVMLRAMIVLLDGTRNRGDLAAELKELLDVPDDRRDEFESQLPQMIEFNLGHMARSGLLVP